jgi:hypothetical protein
MRLLATEASGRIDPLYATDFLPSIVSAPVLVSRSHLAFQHPANQHRNGGMLLSRFPASPPSHFFTNRDGDLLQDEISVSLTRQHP